VFAVVGPFVWILVASFKHQIAIYSGEWPFTPTLANYAEVLLGRRSDFLANVGNSLIVAGASTLLVLVVGTLAAYSLQRFRWPKWVSAAFLGWTLVFHMIPVMTLIGPWYVAFRELGLYDTRIALVLTHVTINLPMTIWLMRAFFREVPRELEEAARVDGCRPVQAFVRVTLPLVIPGLIAAGILAFIFSWNEFPVALSLTSRDLATVPVAIARFAQQYEVQHSQMAAASIISTIPAVMLMAFGQRFIIRGLTLGSVK
jgi:multiple sugar transport system permease protein